MRARRVVLLAKLLLLIVCVVKKLISPNMVDFPVEKITASPLPSITVVPVKQIFSAEKTSVAFLAEAIFLTGNDSPVMLDSSIVIVSQEITRQSAGIMSPASRMSMSPGTRRLVGIIISWFDRLTFVCVMRYCFNNFIAWLLLYSW